MKVIVQDRQCLVDIALQTCGSLEAVFAIAERNNSLFDDKKTLSITEDLTVGQVLDYDLADVQNKQVVSVYRADGVIPAGMVRHTLTEELEAVAGEQTGIKEIRKSADPVKKAIITNIFTKQFNIQFA